MLTLGLVLSPLVLLLAQVLSGAWSNGRPPECAEALGRASNVWERAKSPELRHYCDLVASAESKLAGTAAMAEGARQAALEADTVLPGHAAPHALEGRALAALGQFDRAYAVLAEARARDPRVLDDTPALHAWARVAARTKHDNEAAEAYRVLLPRASALASADRTAAATESGLVLMAGGPADLDSAAAALREALRGAQDETETVAVLALALALDRRGDGDESRALLADRSHGDPRSALAASRAKDLVSVAPAELPAMIGLALERIDVTAAREAWEDYAAHAPAGPWATHARAHALALRSAKPAGRSSR